MLIIVYLKNYCQYYLITDYYNSYYNLKLNYNKLLILDNIQLLCYNCYYLQIGDLFTGKQIEGMEDHISKNESKVDWEIDDYTQQRLKELGLYDSKPVDDGSEFISRL